MILRACGRRVNGAVPNVPGNVPIGLHETTARRPEIGGAHDVAPIEDLRVR